MSQGQRPSAALVFGGPDAGVPGPHQDATSAGDAPPAPHRPRPLNPARRARQRRRAAQRRSRARMREGSEGLLAFLVLLGLTLLLIDLQTQGGAFQAPRAVAAAVLGPLQAGADDLVGGGQDVAAAAERERLLAEVAAAAADQTRLRELEELFGLVAASGQQVLGASVVALEARRGGTLAATIDQGSGAGVAADQAVLAGGGVVGRVRTVGPASAVVMLVGDARFAVGGRVAETGEAGIVRGTGDPDRLTLQLLDPWAEVSIGQRIVTMGSPGQRPFPPDLVVGTVVDPGDPASPERIVTLRPAAQLSRLSVVGVSIRPAVDPAGSVS